MSLRIPPARHQGACACLAASLLFAPQLADAAVKPREAGALGEAAATYPGELTDLPVALVLNGEPRGDVFAKLASDGDLLLDPALLEAFGVVSVGGMRYRVGGQRLVSLRSIQGARFAFDENRLELALTLPASAFGAQRLSLATAGNPRAEQTEETSAFLNYRLGRAFGDGAVETTTLATEAAVRTGAFLLRGDSVYLESGGDTQFVRFQTQLIHDDREQAQRWVAGDSFVSSGELGGTLNLGGVSFTRAWQLTPYFVRYPTATFAGAATLPSDVEVYVGDTQVFRGRLPPGAFELDDFQYYGGRQDVRVLVRDALGEVQVYAYPYYFTDAVLGAGLHEYAYSAGWLREQYGVLSNQYGPFAASATHRYGVNDHVTAGLRGEYSQERGNAGPVLSLRSDHLGTLSLAAALSRDAAADRDGAAFSAGYLIRDGAFTLRGGYREQSPGYSLAASVAGAPQLRLETLAGIGYGTPVTGNADLQYTTRRLRGTAEVRTAALNYSRSLAGRATLFGIVRRTLNAPAETEVFAGLSWLFGPEVNASAFHTSRPGAESQVLQSGNTLGPREGLGYRVSAERSRQDQAEVTRFSPYGEFNARYGSLIVDGRTEDREDGTGSESWAVAVQGSVHAVGDAVGLGRRIEDSFAVAQITPPVEGVRVYHNSQPVGRTDDEGRVMIPAVSSFLDNPVAIDDRDVPIEYNLREVSRIISPPYRSGSRIDFTVRRALGLVGRLHATAGGKPVAPLEYGRARLIVDGMPLEFPTGADGEFYLEDLAPGHYAGSATAGGRDCAFEIVVPEAQGPMAELMEPVVCAH